MPNPDNILAPILVVGAGRTASSYVLHILKLRGDVQTLVENEIVMNLLEMIHDSWWSRNWRHECSPKELERRFVRLARMAMKVLFPSEKPRWAYKAIWEDIDWDVYRKVYPEAKYIHLVRDPRTNIASMMDFIGEEEGHPHWTLDYSSKKYIDSNQKALQLLELDVPYLRIKQEDFLDYPKSAWGRIFDFLELPFMSLDFRKEIHIASSQKGRVKEKRKESMIDWQDLPNDVLALSQIIGYFPGNS